MELTQNFTIFNHNVMNYKGNQHKMYGWNNSVKLEATKDVQQPIS